ncbi:MazG nucleotide pyrophosphohydrolase domain-containing protein [Paradevosia shaoguanensis]|uniref:MazG nucleotide pyrophosphohydrolase domain-containing protein n=1 Tax=Paradevosia shaoguanensis TaxID=1335043 RepID=UPI001933F8A2|nr:MazG nucleotide pyrophosphohydrolase domain-containing protein [Paradevosia shaoguanensis]
MSKALEELAEKVGRVSDIYATRNDIARDDDWYALKLQEEVGELVSAYLRLTGRGRAKGEGREAIAASLADEAADVLAQLLLFAAHNGIDLAAALDRKWFSYLDKSPTRSPA